MQSLNLNLQLNNQKHKSKHNFCKKIKNAVIKPAAQQGFWRHAHFLHIHLSVQVMSGEVQRCAHTHKDRARVCHTHTHTHIYISHTHGLSPYNTQTVAKTPERQQFVCFLNDVILNRRKQWQEA